MATISGRGSSLLSGIAGVLARLKRRYSGTNGLAVPLLMAALALGCPGNLAAEMPQGGTLYNTLHPIFRRFLDNLTHLEILQKKNIDPAQALILARATASPQRGGKDFSRQQASKEVPFGEEAFGIFVIDRLTSAHRLTIDVFIRHPWVDYEVEIVEVGDRHLILAERGGDPPYHKVKYFFNVKDRRAFRVGDEDVKIYSMVEVENALYMLGTTDNESTVIVRLRSPHEPSRWSGYELIQEIEGEKIPRIHAVGRDGPVLELTAEKKQYLLRDNKWTVSDNPDPDSFRYNRASGEAVGLPGVRFWVPFSRVRKQLVVFDGGSDITRRWLVWNSAISTHSGGGEPASGIYELGAAGPRFHPFPNPNYELFRKYRPRRVAEGYTRENTTIRMDVGPFQLEGTRLWFGTSFYDGEGYTGVGGLGYLDLKTRTYYVEYNKALADWSTSSIYVENDYTWLGLVRHPEGEDFSGGLVRYSRKTGKTRTYAVPAVINVIFRVGKHLYLGTSDGIYVLANNKLRHVTFVPGADWHYVVSMANP